MKNWTTAIVIGLVLGLFIGRAWFAPSKAPGAQGEHADHIEHADQAAHDTESEAAPTVWTCSMDPQVQLPEFGLCPICGMDLIPLDPSAAGGGAWSLALGADAAVRAGIETTRLARELVVLERGLVGHVAIDETRVTTVTSWTAGRLDRLYVDSTGTLLRAGDHVAEIYSPALVTAQEEWLQARAASADGADEPEYARLSKASTLNAAAERLHQLGMSEAQLEELAARGAPQQHVTLTAPFGGVVTAQRALEGAYVQPGTQIVELADLDHVWVELDAYETDLPVLRLGQAVSFRVEGREGDVFHSRVAWIDPLIEARTRTARVRLHVDNTAARLKPGAFVRATVEVVVDDRGRAIGSDLSAKWLCPMHPEVVADAPASCPTCGMDLVRGAELGLEAPALNEPSAPPLVVPSSAVLWTGKRSVVYVEDLSAETRTFMGREVELGPRAGDGYVVLEGLMAGETVVTRGAFVIDSELQIRAKRSMMHAEVGGPVVGGVRHFDVVPEVSAVAAGASQTEGTDAAPLKNPAGMGHEEMHPVDMAPGATPEDGGGAPGEDGKLAFEPGFAAFVAAYLDFESALAADDFSPMRGRALKDAFAAIGLEGASSEERVIWQWGSGDLEAAVREAAQAVAIEPARVALEPLSAALVTAVERFGAPTGVELSLFHCPMAFGNRGASWLAAKGPLLNPYFGATMLRCGRVEREVVDQER